MNEYTRLVRPEQPQVQIEPSAKECPSEGFNYPTFRLLSKQGRVNLSQERLALNPSNDYRLFATSNTKGWFAAAGLQKDGSSCLILSPLEELRVAAKAAKDGSEEVFTAKRVLSLETNKPLALAFANNDTRLVIAFEQGQMLVYDTAAILTAGTDSPSPLHALNSSPAPILQLRANPGSDAGLSDIIAVVRGDGTVTLMNTNLEPQGGWQAGDESSTPVAVAWSPKGKHIAIGLRTGDILTYSLANKGSINKHIPPTAQPPLTSLDWLAPGHTFRTVYSPPIPNASDATQHILCVDSKTNTGTHFAPNYPFPLPDREKYQPIALHLPKWDEDAGSSESKNLLVVGDKSSVDLEILGSIGTQWYQQSQENPLSLPLDKNQDDTIIVALEADLTDSASSAPIVYAYLNDGTLQAWTLEHSKPYQGMVNPGTSASAAPQSSTSTSAFEQSSFGAKPPTSTTSAFGSTSAFGQPQSTSAFGQASAPSTFGTAAPSFGSSSFGQPAGGSAFGKPSAFGGAPTTSAFGGGGFGGGNSAFGSGTSSTPSAFGGNSGGGFGAFANKPLAAVAPSAFGQPSFGFAGAPASTTASSSSPPSAPDMTREESMADGTSTPTASGFGGLSLGGDSGSNEQSNKSGIFGSFGSSTSSTAPTESSSAFGAVKPATGFGAFGDLKPAQTFGSSTSSSTETPSAFGASTTTPTAPTQPTFGQSTFGRSSFGKSSFGQSTTSAFGQSGFGQPSAFGQSSFAKPAPPTGTATSGGGFGAFASATPTSFAAAATQQTAGSGEFGASSGGIPASTTGAFGSFASSKPSAFGASATSPFSASTTSPPASGFGPSTSSSFASGGTSPFGAPRNDTTSPFASAATPSSPSPFVKSETTTPKQPSGIVTPQASPPTTPRAEPSMVDSDNETTSPVPAFSSTPAKSPGGAFGGLQASPSPFKPASGFGAFTASTTPQSSPFFKAQAKEPATPAVTAFSSTATSTTPSSSPAPAFGTSSSLGFGAKSAFGSLASPKSAFAPAEPATPTPANIPSSGGFGAFSNSSSAFGTGGAGKSFKDLLKTSDKEDVAKGKSVKLEPSEAEQVPTGKNEAATPKIKKEEAPAEIDLGTKAKESTLTRQDTESSPVKGESSISFENLSLLSEASSFADVSHPSEDEEASESEGETDEHASDKDYAPTEESEEESEGEGSSFLSGSDADYSKEEGEESEEEDDTSQDPVNVLLPPSRSSSQTPQRDIPTVQLTPSPSPSEQSEGSILDTIPEEKEDSTTPPGTPIKQPKPVSAKALGSTPPPPFGLGVGGRNTKPARSSPLANESVSSLDEEHELEKTPKHGQAAKKPDAQPKPVAELPLAKDGGQKPTRPKTPPLLATMAPAKDVTRPSSAGASSASPQPALSGFFGSQQNSTIASPAPVSAFGAPSVFSQPPAPKSVFSAPSLPLKQEATPTGFGGFGLPKAINQAESTGKPISPFQGIPFGKATDKQPATAPTTPPTTFSLGSFNLPSATPSAPTTPSVPLNLGAFNMGPKPTDRPASSPGSLFGAAPSIPQPAPTIPPAIKVEQKGTALPAMASSAPQAGPGAAMVAVQEGLQKECASLVQLLKQDLDNLAQLKVKLLKSHQELAKPLGGSRQRSGLGDPSKWGLTDAEQFGHVLKQYEKDLAALKEQRTSQKQTLKEIQSNMLKAGTRKEEINRFNKAKTDKEFAKMLKARTLGPEHLETQTQLRRNIRTIRDRIQKLEDHLQTSKKKLAQVKSGKPMIRAPTLDTVNRTYRNIDIAVQQQTGDVARLMKRVSKLNLNTPMKASVVRRDGRLPDPVQLPHTPTPSYAIRSAAALNAERSAARLKRALLAVRKEPLLNTEVVGVAPTPAPATSTGKLAIADAPSTPGFKLHSAMPLFATPTNSQPAVDPAFDFSPLPEDKFSPSSTLPSTRRGATAGAKKHSPAPVFKSSGQATSPSAPPSFNWGPLPAFTASPEASKATPAKLPFSFTKPS